LEITTAAQPPVTADGELEILASSRPTAPGARLCPQAAARPHPTAGGEPLPGEVEDTPAAVTGTAQDDADTARALITISVLGALRVQWHPEADQEREITGALQPRTQELLVLLALHPGGTTRDTLVSVLWGEDPPARPTNALHTALARMRRDLAEATGGAVTDIALVDNGHYRLDPAIVHVDYWRFENAMLARRAADTDAQRIAAYREVVDSYGGPLAEGMSKIEWSEPAREAIRRDAIDAVSGLARALVDQDPQQTLDLLEVARAFDPHNELLYRDIMRLQERLGLIDAIPRTLTLLTTRLAEVNNRPSEHAIGLATRLRQRHDDSLSARSRADNRWRT
jgi:DNA-binding SARP family transcriptional activator